MGERTFPRIPYDELESTYIREEICHGDYADREYRRYVNHLTYVEWYTTEGPATGTSGISRMVCSVWHWQAAARYPEAYDTVRRDLGAPTRGERSWTWRGKEDPEARREWARIHRAGWNAVKTEARQGPNRDTDLEERPRFVPFRFPVIPYPDVESSFIQAEIQRGTFDDYEHRQYVNKLAFIEKVTRSGYESLGDPVKHWRIAAEFPTAYDAVRRDFGESTRAELQPPMTSVEGVEDIDAKEREHARQWQTVQEASRRWSEPADDSLS